MELDEFISTSDIISIHLPLVNSTRGMVNEKFLRKMKPTAYIINTSRGAIINEKDLVTCLEEKIIKGAALDTFEQEPLNKDCELKKFTNIILTPHSASNTEEAFTNIMDCCVNNIIAFFSKKELRNVVNPNFIKNVPFQCPETME